MNKLLQLDFDELEHKDKLDDDENDELQLFNNDDKLVHDEDEEKLELLQHEQDEDELLEELEEDFKDELELKE